ncbi:Hypp1511 [Branchiostoma lanceolatum]|nr:Hypp1511 [Branchiostoma lanceolatum]
MWEMTSISEETVMCFFQDVEFSAVVEEDRSAALLAKCMDTTPDAGWQLMCQEIVDIRRQFMTSAIWNQFIASAVLSALTLWQCRQTTVELREVRDKLSRDYDRKLTNIKSRLDKADREFRSILDKFEQEDQTDPIMLLDITMLTSDLRDIRHDLGLLRNDVTKDRRDVLGKRNRHLIAMIPCAVGVAGAAMTMPLAFAAGVTTGYKAMAIAGVVLNGGALAGNAYCAKRCQDTISLIDDRLGAIEEYEDRVTTALERAHELQQNMEQHSRQQERALLTTTGRNAPWILA